MWDEQEIELELLERTREPLDVLSVRQKLPNGDTDRGFGASFDREARATCGGWTRFSKPSDCSLHIARSYGKTRCPRFLSPSNKALATASFPSGMVARFPEAPIACSSRKAGLSDG